ncbi:MAG: NadS family protein [Candidatus Omnitrophota bacterium]|nr:NadS family protein [Candidatus Omnitrophota bacterium]
MEIIERVRKGWVIMRSKDFKDLLTSIDQAREIHGGERKPARFFKFNPVMVRNIRLKLHTSQAKFAHMIGVSVDTLQNWEQGRRRPEGPALVLLRIVEADPGIVMKALHT